MVRLNTQRHRGFYIAAASGIVVGAVLAFLAPEMALVVGIDAFFFVYVALVFASLGKFDEAFLRRHADEDDAPAPFILVVAIAAVAVSTGALFMALNGGQHPAAIALVLGIASVVLGWFCVNTMWAMHYAFEYYEGTRDAKTKKSGIAGGLDFPGGEQPDGMAFLYFSYVLGMTAQTSDTNITSNKMRRLVTLHSVFAFFFNTVIVAAAVNIVVSLGH